MVTADAGRLVVRLPRWIKSAERAALLTRTVARLAAAAIGRPEGAAPDDTSDYRGKADQERRIRDEQEVRDLKLGIEKRATWRRRQVILAWALGALGLLVYVAGFLTYLYMTGQWSPFD
jgi:hypothetical protein